MNPENQDPAAMNDGNNQPAQPTVFTPNSQSAPNPASTSSWSSPTPTPQPTSQTQNFNSPVKPKRKKTKLLGGLAALLLVLAAGSAYAFLWYLPNRPERVWSSSLSRTGEAIKELAHRATEPERLEQYKKSEFTGSLSIKGPDVDYDGTFSSRYDQSKSNSNLDVGFTAEDGERLGAQLEFMSDLPSGSEFPNIYLKVKGIENFGLHYFVPGINNYENKWIKISSDYLMAQVGASEEAPKDPLTSQDIAELAKIAVDVTNDYVFTGDESKSIFVRKSYDGTDSLGNITALRYTVGLSKENFKKYCQAFNEAVWSSEPASRIPGVAAENLDKEKSDSIKECQEGADTIKDTDTFTMWMDRKTKLIHKVRVSDPSDTSTYIEFGQNFTGGDDLPLFVRFHSDKDHYDGEFKLTSNLKTATTTGEATARAGESNEYTVKASFEFKPFDGEINVTPPADAIPIEEVLNQFNITLPSRSITEEETNTL